MNSHCLAPRNGRGDAQTVKSVAWRSQRRSTRAARSSPGTSGPCPPSSTMLWTKSVRPILKGSNPGPQLFQASRSVFLSPTLRGGGPTGVQNMSKKNCKRGSKLGSDLYEDFW